MNTARAEYIAECRKDFKEIQKDNRLLIHYILDKPREINPFEETIETFMDTGEINEAVGKEILLAYYLTHPKKTGKRVGVLIAAKPEGSDKVLMGWSLCNMERDFFNKYIGIAKALDRLQNGNPMLDDDTYFIPNTIEDELEYFSERVERYFKTVPAAVVTTTNAVVPTTNTGGSA
jgi:hypothetical protein